MKIKFLIPAIAAVPLILMSFRSANSEASSSKSLSSLESLSASNLSEVKDITGMSCGVLSRSTTTSEFSSQSFIVFCKNIQNEPEMIDFLKENE